MMAAVNHLVYLQDVMEQRDAALVGLGLGELEERTDLEPLCVPCVTPLEVEPRLNMQDFSKCQMELNINGDAHGVLHS